MKIPCKMLNPRRRWIRYDYATSQDIYSDPTDDWNPRDPDEEMFAYCCGADYVESTTEKTRLTTGKGIKVYAGHIGTGKPRFPDKYEYAHIGTKNGPLTTAIRKKF